MRTCSGRDTAGGGGRYLEGKLARRRLKISIHTAVDRKRIEAGGDHYAEQVVVGSVERDLQFVAHLAHLAFWEAPDDGVEGVQEAVGYLEGSRGSDDEDVVRYGSHGGVAEEVVEGVENNTLAGMRTRWANEASSSTGLGRI